MLSEIKLYTLESSRSSKSYRSKRQDRYSNEILSSNSNVKGKKRYKVRIVEVES